jgi:hypothetical protein
MTEETKERKTRRDKGLIMATTRDLACLTWIGEMYAIRIDQLRRLISRYPDPNRPFKGSLIAETTLKDQIDRWQKAGWAEYRRVLADQPGWVWVTAKGLAEVGLSHYTARPPAATRLNHIFAVNQVRLEHDSRYIWMSERAYRHERETVKVTGPIPDGLICKEDKDRYIAIEVELTAKKPADLSGKISSLVRGYVLHGGASRGFPETHFYVPSDSMKELIVAAMSAAKLEAEEHKRIKIGVMSKGRLLAKYHQ